MINQLNAELPIVDASNKVTPKGVEVHALQVSEFMHCSKQCTELYENVTIENGWIECENERIWVGM